MCEALGVGHSHSPFPLKVIFIPYFSLNVSGDRLDNLDVRVDETSDECLEEERSQEEASAREGTATGGFQK
jgi:hypothetical protein